MRDRFLSLANKCTNMAPGGAHKVWTSKLCRSQPVTQKLLSTRVTYGITRGIEILRFKSCGIITRKFLQTRSGHHAEFNKDKCVNKYE